jgi:hypothetical protein
MLYTEVVRGYLHDFPEDNKTVSESGPAHNIRQLFRLLDRRLASRADSGPWHLACTIGPIRPMGP